MADGVSDPIITYVRDSEVDAELDKKLRALLIAGFPYEKKFRHQRHNNEKPDHRFIIFDNTTIAAHVAVHEKNVLINNQEQRVGGIAEVVVHDAYRGRSYVKRLLEAIDTFLLERGVRLLLLFGKSEIYSSSGYVPLSNTIRHFDTDKGYALTEKISSAMGKSLSAVDFPLGDIDLKGPAF